MVTLIGSTLCALPVEQVTVRFGDTAAEIQPRRIGNASIMQVRVPRLPEEAKYKVFVEVFVEHNGIVISSDLTDCNPLRFYLSNSHAPLPMPPLVEHAEALY